MRRKSGNIEGEKGNKILKKKQGLSDSEEWKKRKERGRGEDEK